MYAQEQQPFTDSRPFAEPPRPLHLNLELQVDQLLDQATALLTQQEELVGQRLDAWHSIGKALNTIKTKKLYALAGYPTFSAYCKKRWGKTVRQCETFISASKVKDEMSEFIEIAPGNMTYYEQLGRIDSLEGKVEVWDKLQTEGKKITLKTISNAIDAHLGKVKVAKPPTIKIDVPEDAAFLIMDAADQLDMTPGKFIEKMVHKFNQPPA